MRGGDAGTVLGADDIGMGDTDVITVLTVRDGEEGMEVDALDEDVTPLLWRRVVLAAIDEDSSILNLGT